MSAAPRWGQSTFRAGLTWHYLTVRQPGLARTWRAICGKALHESRARFVASLPAAASVCRMCAKVLPPGAPTRIREGR